jgi:hypothetical protein
MIVVASFGIARRWVTVNDFEAAAVVGVSADEFSDQAVRLGLTARSNEAHNLRYWRRGT